VQNPAVFQDMLPSSQYSTYSTLTLGSALALFLYPHTLTGILSINSRAVIKRNAILLPTYTILIGLIGLLGFVAIAAGAHSPANYGSNASIPALFMQEFPSWFSGFALATIAIGALAPAAIMSIATANLFTRNIYREYFRPDCTESEESTIAKLVSLLVKVGALIFIVFLPTKLVINFQLLSNIWIIQTLPAIFIGLYTNWFHRVALIIGMLGGLAIGTTIVITQSFQSSVYVFQIGGTTLSVYAAIVALLVNLLLCIVLTPILHVLSIADGEDGTTPADFEARPVPGLLQRPSIQSSSRPAQQSVGPIVKDGYSSRR